MSVLKSVIITLPKGLPKAAGIIPGIELHKSVAKLNFTSLLSDKSKMDPKRFAKHDSMQDDATMFKADTCVRGKKRRLDHLTWEEKLQRKKLKNRVAAQTSRDRKKAKLDELEETVKTLRERNELLTQECTMLRSQNELLVTETKRLRKEKDAKNTGELLCSLCQGRVGCAVSSLGSTVSPNHPLQQGGATQLASSLTLTPGAAILLKIDHLPPLEELFGDLQGDDYIERLEELAESLLREVTAEVETNPCRTNEQVSVKEDTAKKRDHPEGVVGPTPENVEAGRACGGLSDSYPPWHPVASSTVSSTPCTRTNATTLVPIKSEVEVKQEEVDTHDLDTVYGTYDETTNSITIIYPGEENGVGIQECVQEVSTDGACSAEDSAYFTPNCYYSNNQLSPTYTCTDTMSPSSIHSEDMDSGFTQTKLDSSASDCGYESHDSPAPDSRSEKSNLALSDLWHESFSELFPTLA
ncbi:LOW QUALITY PROTEIN: X box binding protein 1 [Halictus rubicundus]|uniref:LOW QUALITY PROTEIN: X box binding protein 1 n=1 Tax=Halictus rubicundus TaxID=77578 RepID=UPI004035C523